MKKIIKILIIWFILGMFYYVIEGLWRIPTNHGYASVWILPVGGLCGLAVGSINQIPKFYNLKIILQSLIGAIITLIIEFISGCIFNLWLGWNLWNYNDMWGNILGQITPLFGLFWLLLMPLAIWLEDKIRYVLFKETKWNYSIVNIYKDFITFK